MPELWTPGMAGPLEDLVGRIHRRIEAFTAEHGLERAMVEVELADGALLCGIRRALEDATDVPDIRDVP